MRKRDFKFLLLVTIILTSCSDTTNALQTKTNICVLSIFILTGCSFIIYLCKQRFNDLHKQLNELKDKLKTVDKLSKTIYDNRQMSQICKDLKTEIEIQLKQELSELRSEITMLKNQKNIDIDFVEKSKTRKIYNKFHFPAGWSPSKEDWNTLFDAVEKSNPTFAITLQKNISLSDIEKKISYLCKIGVRPSTISYLLCLENVSVYRKRLYEKLTGRKGCAKDFDTYIYGL